MPDRVTPIIPAARVVMRSLLSYLGVNGRLFTETMLRGLMAEHGYEIDRDTLHYWVEQDRHYFTDRMR